MSCNFYDEKLISETRITDPSNDYCLEPVEGRCNPADKTVQVYRLTSSQCQDDSWKFAFDPDKGIQQTLLDGVFTWKLFLLSYLLLLFVVVNTTILTWSHQKKRPSKLLVVVIVTVQDNINWCWQHKLTTMLKYLNIVLDT